ncbi:hypothetical protein G7Y79_00116g101780 [Physcia stellaris]|nr:hypothetical protein G7Y79_00116g101780 [Physcia stellaris]
MYAPHLTIALTFSALFRPVLSWSTWAIEDAINPQDILTPDCSVDTSTSTVTDWALTPAWQNSMQECLFKMNSSSWDGNLCEPEYPDISRDVDPRPNFLFWKAHARNFKDAQDCYNMCAACLLKGIQIGLAVTTWCHYAAYTVGWKKATCQMGFDYHESGSGGSW